MLHVWAADDAPLLTVSPDPFLEQDRSVRREATPVTTRRLLPRLHWWRRLRRSVQLSPAPIRLSQPKCSNEADLRALHLRNRYPTDQVYVVSCGLCDKKR